MGKIDKMSLKPVFDNVYIQWISASSSSIDKLHFKWINMLISLQHFMN